MRAGAKTADERLTGRELRARTIRDFTIAMSVSNCVGALIVFVFLTLILPVRHPPAVGEVFLWNGPAFVIWGLAASYVGPRWGRSISLPRLRWLQEERVPTPEERRRVLRNPLVQLKVVGGIWAAAAVVFGLIDLHFSVQIAINVASGIVMGDRKSTRLNSSHDQISYAVFCLKKKKKNIF